MPITKIPLNHHFISLYTDDDSGIIFHHTLRTLSQLNPIAITILLAIDEGLNQQQTLAEINQLTSLSNNDIIPIYQQIKALYCADKSTNCYADGQYPEISILPVYNEPLENLPTFCIANTVFGVLAACAELTQDIAQLLSPIQTQKKSIAFVIEIRKNKQNLYQLQVNNLAVEEPCCYEEIVPLLIDRMQILAFQQSDYLFCFHGAALQWSEVNVLLPGKSGAGKSTLSAELTSELTSNNTSKPSALFSDEMIVLNSNFQLSAIELPIAIKSGSWETLQVKYPTLVNEKIWHRLDGRRLKYVWPKQFASKPNHSQCYIVNPTYLPEKNDTRVNSINKLSPFQTIAMLTSGGYQVGKELVDIDIENLLAFLENTPSFNMVYHSSTQAFAQLQHLIEDNKIIKAS